MKVRTLYGAWDVAHPAVMRLVHTPQFQRLKHVHQYGVRGLLRRAGGRFTRYQHSLGVAHLVAQFQGSWQAQAAALLHDVGHAAFSHDLEPLLAQAGTAHRRQEASCSLAGRRETPEEVSVAAPAEASEEAPHELAAQALRAQPPIASLLAKYGATPQDLAPEAHGMLESPLPQLCADRLDYNLQGAVRAGMWSRRQLRDMLAALHYDHAAGAWCVTDMRAAAALMHASVSMSERLWPGVQGAVMAHWLRAACAAMLRAGLWSWEDVLSGTDAHLWTQLQLARVARPWVQRLRAPARYMTTDPDRVPRSFPQAAAPRHLLVTSKFRGVNPLVALHGNLYPLTRLCEAHRRYFADAQAAAARGSRMYIW